MVSPPRASPVPPLDISDTKTPTSFLVTTEYVKNKVRNAEARGKKNATLAGLSSGAAVLVAGIGVTFGVFFQLEARAADMDAGVLEKADAGAKRLVSELKTDVELLKRDVQDLKASSKRDAENSAEILRILKRRDGR